MKKKNITISARIEKPFYPQGSEDADITLSHYKNSYEVLKIQQDKSLGAVIEWFPGQDRSRAITQAPKLRLGAYGSYDYAPTQIDWFVSAEPSDFSGYATGDTITVARHDIGYGAKMALDVPVGKGLLSPYTKAGVTHILLTAIPDADQVNTDKMLTGSTTHAELSLINPEVGVEARLPFQTGVALVLNAHGRVLNFEAHDESTAIYAGGGVGLAF